MYICSLVKHSIMATDTKVKDDSLVSHHEGAADVIEKGEPGFDSDDPEEEFDQERVDRILKAVDIRLIPVLTLLYVALACLLEDGLSCGRSIIGD